MMNPSRITVIDLYRIADLLAQITWIEEKLEKLLEQYESIINPMFQNQSKAQIEFEVAHLSNTGKFLNKLVFELHQQEDIETPFIVDIVRHKNKAEQLISRVSEIIGLGAVDI